MTNGTFEVCIDTQTGTLISVTHADDEYRMNWIEGKRRWGEITCLNPKLCAFTVVHQKTIEDDNSSQSLFQTDDLHIKVERSFLQDALFCERYTFTNITDHAITYSESDLGIVTPFNDNYQDFATCSTNRCHTHIWCGKNVSYVNALRMGGKPPHLGLVLTSGSISEYSIIRESSSNDRGDFILHPSWFTIEPRESYGISWVLFWHEGEEDFYHKASNIKDFIQIEAKHYTYFPNEQILLHIRDKEKGENLTVTTQDRPLEITYEGNTLTVEDLAHTFGEREYLVTRKERQTFCKVLVVPELKDIVKARCTFIREKQQYINEGQPLHGAYLIYDRETAQLCYGHRLYDHGSGREKLGMGVLIAMLLNSEYGPEDEQQLLGSLDLYYRFVERELYDQEKGTVFNRIGKSNYQWHRLYNYPWLATLQMELYKVTQKIEYLHKMTKTIQAYYEHGGERFYSLCLPMLESVHLLEQNSLKTESDLLRSLYLNHADVIMVNKLAYPAHEVDYEQSIVAPAASYTLQAYLLSGQEKYLQAAKEHIRVLELFNGNQPDYHLNKISIRHWDGFWFGKRRLYGDTFPHYWSVLSAEVFSYYYEITKIERYHTMAQTILRNNLCLFDQSGFGSSAYLYPFSINDERGKFLDPWANDQDWALIYAMRFLDR